MNAISINNFVKKYNNFTLTIDKLNVPSGYITGFIGPNGSGKTTTIKSILGMLTPNEGSINVLPKEDLAYVGDESGFLVESKLKLIRNGISSFYKNWDHSLYQKYIDRFGLDENKLYKDLSKGQKKQFELIIALSHHPKLLIMDEPTSGLDPLVRNEFLELLQEHMEMDNMTVFYSTHITTDLDKAADYIVMVYKGKILLTGEKDEILNTHVLVKCKKELLDSSIRNEFISINENSFGFEGLMSDKSKAYELFGNEAIYEKCNLEDLLLHYTRGY